LGRSAEPELYYTVDQNIAITDAGLSLVVRSSVAPETLVASLRSAVSTVNPKLAIFNIKTMEQIVGESLWQLTLYRWLIGVFAVLALTLAAIGLFGLIAYTANSRLNELAIRRALGSDQWTLARLIFERGLKLSAAGVAGGIVAVLACTWWLADRTAGLRPDVATGIIVSTIVLIITVLACLGPSLRAATVNPMAALRQE
jgi:putative ABC transport system permease protein